MTENRNFILSSTCPKRWLFFFLTCIPSASLAQTPPNAGSLERQLRQEVERPSPFQKPDIPAPALQEDSTETVMVSRFILSGVTLLPPAEVEKLLNDRIGTPQTLRQLEDAARIIETYYRDQGYFARAYLPQQDVTEGVIRIEVVEGHLGKVEIIEEGPLRTNSGFVKDVIANGLESGKPYSAKRLERGLLLANDLPGVHANGILKAGDKVGASDLTIQVNDTPLFTGHAGANNHGSKSTGTYQAHAGLQANNINGIGDQASLNAVVSEHLAYGQLGYSIPIGYDGLRAGISGNYLAYELGDRFESLDAEGVSYGFGANLSYPFLRSVEHSIWGDIRYSNRNYKDDALGTALSRKQINALSLALSSEVLDTSGKGGITRYHLELTGGELDISAIGGGRMADAAGPDTYGHYTKLYAQVNRNQSLGNDWFLRLHGSAQWAGNNLDSSEKFALGGPYGVRAYPVSEALGDSGLLLTFEAHKFVKAWDLYAFADAGVIRQHTDTWANWNAGSNTPNSYWLGGIGIGVDYTFARNISLNTLLALPIGANKGAAISGNNQDGSSHGPRLWVGLTALF